MARWADRLGGAKTGRELLRTVAALADQAWLSAVNFAVGLLLIRLSTKVDYALYVQLFAALMLSVSIRQSLVGSPLLTLAPRRTGDDREALFNATFALQGMLALALIVIAAAGALLIDWWVASVTVPFTLVAGSTAWLLGYWWREFVRLRFFADLRPERTLGMDIAFGVANLLGILACLGDGLTVIEVVWVSAASNLLAGGVLLWRLGLLRHHFAGIWRDALRDVWPLAKWGLPGTVISWTLSMTFPYFAALAVSTVAAANLAATKLLVMPLGIVAMALTNLMQPRVSGWLGSAQIPLVRRINGLSLLASVGLVAAYVGLLMLAYPLIEQYVLGSDYAGLSNLTLWWGVYGWLGIVRSIGIATVLAGGQYRSMLIYNVVALAVYAPGLLVAGFIGSELAILCAVIAAELMFCAMIWGAGIPLVYRKAREEHQAKDTQHF